MENNKKKSIIPTIILTILSLLWIYPIILILLNSLKKESAITTTGVFELPLGEIWNGFTNYVASVTQMDFLKSFWYSLVISVMSVVLILLCCSMCAWYIVRVNGVLSKILKGIPLEIEEAALIDGCNPLQVFFKILIPILKPTIISTAILQLMWVWNDYLLPTLVLDIKKYRTIPMAVQYFRGSFGHVQMGPMMASIMIDIIPIVIVYLVCQKYIIEGVVAGAVKG